MTKNVFKLVLFIMLAVCFSACNGRDGLDGRDGLNGTISETYLFEIKASDWSWDKNEQAYVVTFNKFSAINQLVFDEGTINVYMADGAYDRPLPWTLFHLDGDYQWSETYSYKIKPGTIVFYEVISDNYDVELLKASMKVVVTRPI